MLLDGQSVRVKLTREEKRRFFGQRDPETSDSQDEDTDLEPDYLVDDEERNYIDHWAEKDPMEDVPVVAFLSFSREAELARRAVPAAVQVSKSITCRIVFIHRIVELIPWRST